MSRNIDLPHSSAAVLSSCRIFSFHDGFNENVDGLPPEEVFGLEASLNVSRFGFGFGGVQRESRLWGIDGSVEGSRDGRDGPSIRPEPCLNFLGMLARQTQDSGGAQTEKTVAQGIQIRAQSLGSRAESRAAQFVQIRGHILREIQEKEGVAMETSVNGQRLTRPGSKFDSAAERLSLRLGTTISETWIPWMPSPGRRESGEKNLALIFRTFWVQFRSRSARYDSLENTEAAAPPPDTRPTVWAPLLRAVYIGTRISISFEHLMRSLTQWMFFRIWTKRRLRRLLGRHHTPYLPTSGLRLFEHGLLNVCGVGWPRRPGFFFRKK
ncbi:hypothetical protein BDZ89DRAFT_1039073 [Hymenopellis radicata]|nr:hypothetical protein BDZ89DRAFT_1039073 [Hymenopellis radicata]